MNEIKEGEVVVVSGETRRMTVDAVMMNHVHCCWLDDQGEVRSAWFLLSSLEVAE